MEWTCPRCGQTVYGLTCDADVWAIEQWHKTCPTDGRYADGTRD